MKYNISAMLCVALVATNTYADELFFECEFEKSKLSGGDADAQAWLNDFSFRRHKFVYQTEPPKIVDGPDSGSF